MLRLHINSTSTYNVRRYKMFKDGGRVALDGTCVIVEPQPYHDPTKSTGSASLFGQLVILPFQTYVQGGVGMVCSLITMSI